MEESIIDKHQYEIDYMAMIKKKIYNLCQASKFCSMCYEANNTLWHLDSEFCIIINGKEHKGSMKDIVCYVLGNEWNELLSSVYICNFCSEKSIQSYIFIYNVKEMSRVLNIYLGDLMSKVNDVSDQLTDAAYENSNVVIVLEKSVECSDYIDTTEFYDKLSSIQTKKELGIINTNKKTELPKRRFSKMKTKRFARNVIYKCMKCKMVIFNKKSLMQHEVRCKHPIKSDSLQLIECKICNETFKTQQSIKLHYKVHGMERCRICHFIMPEGTLLDHLKLNHEEVIHICKVCNHISFSAITAKNHLNKRHRKPLCVMCLKNFKESNLKTHSCKFSCVDCTEIPCIHHKYLVSYREQVLSGETKLKCLDCDYVYLKKKALIGHVNREHLDYHPFTCAHCSQQFYSKVTLSHHLRRYHGESVVCEYCDEDLKSKSSLEEHIKMCKLITRPFQCEQCVSSFDSQQDLASHKDSKHKVELYPCSLCNGKFVSNLKLKEHELKIHNGIQIKRKRTNLECTICDIKFDERKEFTTHISMHGPGTKFPCKICNTEYDDIKKLHAHTRLHGDDVVKCGACNKLITEAYVAQHLMYCEANRKDQNNSCEICGKSFQSDSILKVHKHIHKEPEACPFCSKLMKPIYLKRHIKYNHGPKKEKKPTKKNLKMLKCEWCGHMVTRLGELESHINRFHLKVKPYECNICSKKFCGKERLKEHVQTHTNENSCYCTVCGKRFANKVCLKMHSRLHSGLTPYECDICGEKFRSSSIMKTHKVKKHTEKDVPCPLCDTMFYLAREMRNHFKKVHWKVKGKKFDPREVKEISKEYYYLFEDRRRPKLGDDDLVLS